MNLLNGSANELVYHHCPPACPNCNIVAGGHRYASPQQMQRFWRAKHCGQASLLIAN
jgi:hypothetical protein